MKIKFMDDARQDQLMKSAKDCMSLMNVGVDPNQALTKVAEDLGMNDKEVELVSHAVNNASQLAHLQTSDEGTKDGPFPLTNAHIVIQSRETGKTPRSCAVDQPDGNQLARGSVKEAYDSLFENSNFRGSIPIADLREGWGIKDIPTYLEMDQDVKLAEAGAISIKIEDAKLAYVSARDKADALLGGIIEEFRKIAAPKFSDFERACSASGVNDEILELLHNALPKLARPMHKTAGVVRIDRATAELVQCAIKASELLKTASTAYAEVQSLEVRKAECFRIKTAEEKGGGGGSFYSEPKFEGGDFGAFDLSGSILGTDSAGNIGHAQDTLSSGLGYEAKGESKPQMLTIDPGLQQHVNNFGARGQIERLMNDDYIKGHSIGEVVDSYNNAMSVNPNFGEAELKAYIRQDLATQGATPLDLMIRASKSHGKGEVQ